LSWFSPRRDRLGVGRALKCVFGLSSVVRALGRGHHGTGIAGTVLASRLGCGHWPPRVLGGCRTVVPGRWSVRLVETWPRCARACHALWAGRWAAPWLRRRCMVDVALDPPFIPTTMSCVPLSSQPCHRRDGILSQVNACCPALLVPPTVIEGTARS
jgi:hypothetical protein